MLGATAAISAAGAWHAEWAPLRALLECSLAEGADFPGPEPAPEPRRKWEPRRWAEMVVRRKPSSGPAEIAEPPLIIR